MNERESKTAPGMLTNVSMALRSDPKVPEVNVVELPIQRATRERLLAGMCGIIRRMTRVAPRGDLVLADHDERELAVELFTYLEGVRHG
jgi:hypothetical protein